MAEELPKVAVLPTGGAIASKHDPVRGGYVPADIPSTDMIAGVVVTHGTSTLEEIPPISSTLRSARDVTKTNTIQVKASAVSTSASSEWSTFEKIRFYRAPLRCQTLAIDSRTQVARVDIVMSYACGRAFDSIDSC